MKAKNLLKKAFLLLTLMGGASSAWATDVTVGRTLSSNSATDYTLTTVTNTTVTLADGTGESGKNKGLYHASSSSTSYAAKCYRDRKSSNVTAFNSDVYAGFQLVVANGYKLSVSKINVDVAVSANFTYRIVVLDNADNVLYTSSDFSITNYNSNTATNITKELTPSGLVLGGTVKAKLYYWNTGNSGSKYIVPITFTIDGALETATNYTITTNTTGDGTVTGAGSYVDGFKATLKATPGASVFTKWQKDGEDFSGNTENPIQVVVNANATYTAVFTSATVYTITGAIADGQSSYGSITNAGANSVVEDETITFEATANTGYRFVKWQKDGVDYSTNASITVTATADATYTAIFEAKKAITFDKGEGTGTVPSTAYVVSGEDYTIPEAYFVYKSGATLTGWNDGVNTYAPGATISNVTTDIALTAVFTDNTVNLGDAAAIVNWTFDRSHDAPSIACEGNEMDYVQHTTISGTRFDAVMHVNTVKGAVYDKVTGKLNNTSRASDGQVNRGTKFTIPVIKGTVIKYNGTNGEAAAGDITFGGENGSVSGAVTTYTYSGATGTLDIIDTKGSFYPSGISVAYPTTLNLNASGYATYSNAFDVEVSGANAYIAELNFGTSTITCTEIASDKVPAGNGVLLYGEPGATVTLTPTTGAAALGTNNLKATTLADGSLATKDANNYYALSGDTFMEYTGAAFVHNKAYFEVEGGVVQARSMRIVFDDKVTGVEAVEAASDVKTQEGKFIENGKLVIVKNGVKYNTAGAKLY